LDDPGDQLGGWGHPGRQRVTSRPALRQ